MKTNTDFMNWWLDKGTTEYLEMCRTWEVQPTADIERVVKYTAWEAYSAGMARAMNVMAEAA
jgi:hypothetical protein